ncbi:MAG: hypothetical protein LBP88_02690 [Treponema sp.]|nr:hypothetical protein [Treponema sp.]
MKIVFGFMLVLMFGFFVSCSSVPKPQKGDIVEGKIVRIVDGYTMKLEKKSAGQKFGEWLFGTYGDKTDYKWVRDKKGKICFVQVANEGRRDQQKFFLDDDEAQIFNYNPKIGDRVTYEILYFTEVDRLINNVAMVGFDFWKKMTPPGGWE